MRVVGRLAGGVHLLEDRVEGRSREATQSLAKDVHRHTHLRLYVKLDSRDPRRRACNLVVHVSHAILKALYIDEDLVPPLRRGVVLLWLPL